MNFDSFSKNTLSIFYYVVTICYIEVNTNIAILQIHIEYRKAFGGLIFTELEQSKVIQI